MQATGLPTTLTCHAHCRCTATMPTINHHREHFSGLHAAIAWPLIDTHHAALYTYVAHTLTSDLQFQYSVIQKFKVKGHLVQKLEWKQQTHKQTDRWKQAITYTIYNVVGQ